MEKARVSFVILTWNSQKYIRNCLSSVMSLDNIEKEVFVVENGSTDSTMEILKEFDGINVIKLDKNIGTTRSRNIAIKQRNREFEFLCVLDSDTVVNEAAFDDMIDILRSDDSFGLAGPEMKNASGEHQITAKKFPTALIKLFKACPVRRIHDKGVELERYDFDEGRRFHIVDHVISACWLVKNTVVEKVGMLDERIHYAPEDNDYCMRVWKSGYKVVYCPENGIIHDTQRISKKKLISYTNFTHILGLIYYFFKHRYFIKAPDFGGER